MFAGECAHVIRDYIRTAFFNLNHVARPQVLLMRPSLTPELIVPVQGKASE